MCLLLVAIDSVPGIPLLLLGNRDEYHARASTASSPWPEDARIVGGRDRVAGGAWLALRSDGRFAAVTNLRSGLPATAPLSRGDLVRGFAMGHEPPDSFLRHVAAEAGDYGPFNLVLGDPSGVLAFGSAAGDPWRLDRGVHVVSNGPLGVHWPKTQRLLERFDATSVEGGGSAADMETRWLDLLLDEAQPLDAALPDTGVGIELERRLGPVFIRGEGYGTRASTLALRAADGRCTLRERRFGPAARPAGESRWEAVAGDPFTRDAH